MHTPLIPHLAQQVCTYMYRIPFSPPTSVTAGVHWKLTHMRHSSCRTHALPWSRHHICCSIALSQHTVAPLELQSYLLLLYSIYLGNHSSLGVPHICTLQCSVRLRTITAPLEQNHICCSTAFISATTALLEFLT